MKSPIALYKELKKLGIEKPNEFLDARLTLACGGDVKVDLIKLDDWALEQGKGETESLKDFLGKKAPSFNFVIIEECF